MVDIGGLYYISHEVGVGAMIRNLFGFPFEDKYSSFSLPRHLTIGVSRHTNGYTLSMDSEYIFGTYSGLEKKDVKILFLRGGLEKEITPWLEGRMGLAYPVIAWTSSLGDMKDDIPFPKMGGSIGLGFKYRPFIIDLSIYGDPAKSYMEQKAVLSSVVSITFEY